MRLTPAKAGTGLRPELNSAVTPLDVTLKQKEEQGAADVTFWRERSPGARGPLRLEMGFP